MLIAIFGPTTGWVGKTITFENDAFVLQDHGPISASDVMNYDLQGHLVWANDGTRAWVGSQAAAGTTSKSGALPKEAKFKFVNYDGGMSSHHIAEPWGTLVLPSNGDQWELHWGPESKVYSHGGLANHSIDIEATGPSSCRVLIRDIQKPLEAASFELPENAATELETALKERESRVAPSRAKIVPGFSATTATTGAKPLAAPVTQTPRASSFTPSTAAESRPRLAPKPASARMKTHLTKEGKWGRVCIVSLGVTVVSFIAMCCSFAFSPSNVPSQAWLERLAATGWPHSMQQAAIGSYMINPPTNFWSNIGAPAMVIGALATCVFVACLVHFGAKPKAAAA